MKNKIALAVSAAFGLAFAGSAFAAASITDGINPPSATDTTNDGSYATGGVSSGSSNLGDFSVNKYNAGQVLVGATFSAVLANEPVTFTRSGGGIGNAPSGTAYAAGSLSIGGITATANSTSINATSVGSSGQSDTIASYTVAGSAITQTQLNNLYGAGTLAGTVGEALFVSKTDSGNRDLIVDNSSNRTATVTYNYSTLNHANGSFDSSSNLNSLTLSFGDVVLGSTPAGLGFNLYNLLGSYGLQVVGANYSGSSLFSLTGITGTSNLAAGSFASGVVNMTTALAAGDYSGLWTITVADSASGIGAGKNLSGTDTLTLAVNAHVAAVPEPGEWAMMLAGFGLIGFMAKRRRRGSAF